MASSVDAKLLKSTKFPAEFNHKVDMKKVNVEVMKKWIAGKISEILGNEDDVVIELCFNLLEGSRFPDIKVLQIQLTGFLDKDTAKFCKELWLLCLSAQSNPQGVPKELLEAKKLELIQEKIDAERAAEEAQRRKEQEKQRDKNIDNIRQRERGERGRGRGAEAHLAFPLIGVQSIRTFPLVVVAAGQTTEDVDRRPQEDHCRTPDPDPGHHRVEDIETMTPQNHVDASLLRVGLGLPHGEAMLEVESEEFQDAVMIELDPSHLQMLLAHVHPEAEEGARLPSHLAVRRRLLDLNPIVEGRTHHCLQALDLVH
ncbi:hypothetical protein MMC28_002154 [Mycoblastus sanguinarius]|nr:hypothetical protein [Mycoblastus sanguinarius]